MRVLSIFKSAKDWLDRWIDGLTPARVHPNHITCARLLLLGALAFPLEPWMIALVVMFFYGGDVWDGSLAIQRNQVTRLGRILDPVADKLMVAALVLYALHQALMNPFILVAVLCVEVVAAVVVGSKIIREGILSHNVYGRLRVTSYALAAVLVFSGWSVSPGEIIAVIGAGFGVLSIFKYLQAQPCGIT